jgi:hypothetical protein
MAVQCWCKGGGACCAGQSLELGGAVPNPTAWRSDGGVSHAPPSDSDRAGRGCHCRFAEVAPRHHDLLVRVDCDVAVALDLFELATTWGELDYGGQALVPPADWLEFGAAHRWRDPDVAERLFSVAVDVAFRRGVPAATPRFGAALAS